MESKKPLKKTAKVATKPVPPVSEKAAVASKPLTSGKTTESRRPVPSAARTPEPSSKAENISTPKQTSHRHSKVSVPATPIVQGAVAKAVVAKPSPVNHEDVARLAYTFWEERSYAHGFADEDWQKALTTLSATA
jgi:hypothetical protein